MSFRKKIRQFIYFVTEQHAGFSLHCYSKICVLNCVFCKFSVKSVGQGLAPAAKVCANFFAERASPFPTKVPHILHVKRVGDGAHDIPKN